MRTKEERLRIFKAELATLLERHGAELVAETWHRDPAEVDVQMDAVFDDAGNVVGEEVDSPLGQRVETDDNGDLVCY